MQLKVINLQIRPLSASFHSPGNLIGLEWKEAERGVERGQNRPLLPLGLSPEVM